MEKLRHYCRNPRCRSKLKEAVENPRAALCTRGCHSSFYLKRCLVCERPFAKKSTQQKVCFRNTCRTAFRQQTATVPDGPDCQWKRGEYERLAAKNRAGLAGIGEACFTEPDWREVVSPDGVPATADLSLPAFLKR